MEKFKSSQRQKNINFYAADSTSCFQSTPSRNFRTKLRTYELPQRQKTKTKQQQQQKQNNEKRYIYIILASKQSSHNNPGYLLDNGTMLSSSEGQPFLIYDTIICHCRLIARVKQNILRHERCRNLLSSHDFSGGYYRWCSTETRE